MKKEYLEVLLVEDNHSDAELTVMALEKSKPAVDIIWLKDGREALDFIFAEGSFRDRKVEDQPKVMLLDLNMPKIGGLEVLKRIRNDERTAHMPVVVLTSSREDRDIIESYELGVNSYIVKPVDYEKFTNSIREIGYYWLLVNNSPNMS